MFEISIKFWAFCMLLGRVVLEAQCAGSEQLPRAQYAPTTNSLPTYVQNDYPGTGIILRHVCQGIRNPPPLP